MSALAKTVPSLQHAYSRRVKFTFIFLNHTVIDWAVANTINRKLKVSQIQIPSAAFVSPMADKVISCFVRNPTVHYRVSKGQDFISNQAKLLNTYFIKVCLKLSDYLRLVLK
jgi:hypothetical protein